MNCILHSCAFGAFTQACDPSCDIHERNSESEKSEKPPMSFKMRDFFLSTGVFQVPAWLFYLSKHTHTSKMFNDALSMCVDVTVFMRVSIVSLTSWHVTPCSRIRSRWVRAGGQTPVHTGRALESINPHTVWTWATERRARDHYSTCPKAWKQLIDFSLSADGRRYLL